MRPALFCDRDGTLIVDQHYPKDPSRVALLPGVPEALRELQTAGFLLVLVSNQSGVARGLLTRAEAAAVHKEFVRQLSVYGVCLDACYYCFHGPADACACRKPQPGMLLQAAHEHPIALSKSWMVGDKHSDMQAAYSAGVMRLAFGPHAGISDASASCWREIPPKLLFAAAEAR